MKLVIFAIFLVLINKCAIGQFRSSSFSYKYRLNWAKYFPKCGGSKQSPININTLIASPITFPTNLDLSEYHQLISEITMTNAGHTVKVSFMEAITIRGGPAKEDTYRLDEFHFHFGKDSDGAEHSINGFKNALEIHFVHRNTKYANLHEAVNHADGIIVIAILGGLSNWDVDYDLLTLNLHRIKHPSNVTIPGRFYLSTLIPNIRTFSYWTYKGSLTTPLCQEAVTWVISDTILPVSYNQLRKFDVLLDESGEAISGNIRPLQPLNGRKIHYVSYIPRGQSGYQYYPKPVFGF